MVFWVCNQCGRLHNHVVTSEGRKESIDQFLHEVSLGVRGGGSVPATLVCSNCGQVGTVAASRSVFMGFSFKGNVSFRYFETIEGAKRVFPDHDLIEPTPPSESPEEEKVESNEE